MERHESKEKKDQFLSLRGVEGYSFSKISQEIGVSKTTLISWEKELRHEIDNIINTKARLLASDLTLSCQARVKKYSELLSSIETEIESRDLKGVKTEHLFKIRGELMQELERYLGKHGEIKEFMVLNL